MLHANSINRNDGLFTAGVRSQEILRSADSAAFIKTLVDFHPRIRPSADSASGKQNGDRAEVAEALRLVRGENG